MKMMKIT